MPNPCLIIFSTSEQPAWDIPLSPTQAYIGKDERETGCLALIISLDGATQLTPDQETFLVNHPDVLRFDVFADCNARSLRCLDSIPQPTDAFLSHRDGKTLLPLMEDEPIWRRQFLSSGARH
jgi:hypothetical protein